MVFARRFKRILAAPKQGEIALTLTVLSLLTMLVGTVIGLNRTQDIRSSAAGPGQFCGLPCTTNANCGTDSASGSKTQCDFSKNPRICVSVNTQGNPRCPTGLKTCGESCSADYNCNAPLTCDRNKKICSGSMCPAVGPTASSSTGARRGGETCEPSKNECVAGFYCGRPGGVSTPYTCQPGLEGGGTGGGPTAPVPSGVQYQGSTDPNRPVLGNSFVRNLATKCKIGWSYDKDPQIETLYLQSGGNKITLTDRNLPKQRGSYSGHVDEAVVSFKNGGIYISFDPLDDINGDGKPEIYLKVSLGGGTVREWYFDKPSPDWLGAEDTLVYLKYHGLIASERRWWYQQETVSSCFRGTITPPSQTPTPAIECGKECTIAGELQCKRHSLGQPNCRYRRYGEITNPKMYCLLPGNDSLECKPPTTPTIITPSVTTPTPLPRCGEPCTSDFYCQPKFFGQKLECRRKLKAKPTELTKYCLPPISTGTDLCDPITPTVITPTLPTPSLTQPPRCYKSVYFMIDTSSTQRENIKAKIEGPLNQFFSGKTFKDVTFAYNTFNIVAPRQSGAPSTETIQFNLVDNQNWTNLNAAFEVIKTRKEDVKVLISDGIPSVLSPFNNVRANNSTNIPLQCVYDTDGTNAKGCTPEWDTPGRDDNYMKENDCKKDRMFGARFNEYCKEPYPVGTSDATHAVRLGGNEGISKLNLGKAGVAPANIYDDMTSFIGALESIIQKAPCHPVPPNIPRASMSSFKIQNKSTNKTISSVDVKTCDSSGSACQIFTNPVKAEPQQVAQFSQSIPENVPNTSRELITCSVNYADGTSLPCPRKETQNESVQFNLSATNRAVTGNTQTFLQASDLNGDGRVNVIDLVLLQNQRNISGVKTYDIILDGVINAQDFAVVTERLGQSTQ